MADIEKTIIEELPEPTEEQQDFGIAGMVSQTMARTWDMIDWYNSVLATLSTMELDEEDKEIIEKIQSILTNEYGNFAVLESIAQGKREDIEASIDELTD